MRLGFLIQTYLTAGATFGGILAGPVIRGAVGELASHPLPHDWEAAKPLVLPAILATGHAVLRMYIWLPSMVYYVGRDEVSFVSWLFGAGW